MVTKDRLQIVLASLRALYVDLGSRVNFLFHLVK
jgi:hypothetical protein